jgi:hypothetical protein
VGWAFFLHMNITSELNYELHVINGKTKRVSPTMASSDAAIHGINQNLLKAPDVTKPFGIERKYPYAFWGANNTFPETIIDAGKKCGLVRRCVNFLAQITLGNGIEIVDGDGNLYKDSAKFIQLFHNTRGDMWFLRSAKDYWQSGNTFSKLIMNSEAKRKPALIVHEPFNFCRKGVQDPSTLLSEWAYISAQWKNKILHEGDPYLNRIKLLDSFLYQNQLDNLNESVYMICNDSYSAGDYFYSELPWHSLDVLKNIAFLAKLPDIEESIWLKSIALKYHIEILEDFLAAKCGYTNADDVNYKKTTREERLAKLKEIHDEIDTYLTGAEHQHTSYISMFKYSQSGDLRHGVIITPLDDKLKKDAHLPNSQNATGKVLEAFGLTPQLTGSTMSNALSQGGGSDIRESWNVAVSSIYSDQQTILFPMKVFMQQHGLPADCTIRVKNIVQNTLDKSKSGTQTAFPTN